MYYEELEQRTREHRSALMREAEQMRLRAASRTQRHWRRSRALAETLQLLHSRRTTAHA
jgi:predicted transposase YdaD